MRRRAILVAGVLAVAGVATAICLKAGNRSSEQHEQVAQAQSSLGERGVTHPYAHDQADGLGDLQGTVGAVVGRGFDEDIEKYDDYFPINDDTLPTMLSEVQIENPQIVSAAQMSNLRSVLETNILSFNHGSAEEILADRLRAPHFILPEATKFHTDLLRRHCLRAEEPLPNDPEAIMRLLVNRQYNGNNGSGFKDLYKDMSVQGSEFMFRLCKTMPTTITHHLDILRDTGANTFYSGVVTHHPSIEYHNSPSNVLKKRGELIIADARIAASDSRELKYSRLKRFYWSPDDDTWLPMELVSLYAKDRKADEWF